MAHTGRSKEPPGHRPIEAGETPIEGVLTVVSRRDLLTGFIGLAAVAAAPIAITTGCGPGRRTSASSTTRPLPIPPLAEATVRPDGIRRFRLRAQTGVSEILPGRQTPTWGYDSSILGPTLRARRGEAVRVDVRNATPEPTTVHWHGMHVPARMDGGPHQMIPPGDDWTASWTVDQPAATLWYHPHPHGTTEKQVYRGLSGFFLIDDDTDALDLPKTYGVDDIPLVIQDRRFTPDGTLDETDNTDNGLLGKTIVTNGLAGAHLDVHTDRLRLRLLNGSSGRIYSLGFPDDRPYDLIATDGGLLANPVRLNRIQLSPGERAEIVVTLRAGETTTLRALPIQQRAGIAGPTHYGFDDTFDILEFHAAPTLSGTASIPATLTSLPATITPAGPPTRSVVLSGLTINGRRMDMNRIDMTIPVDTTEVWSVRNTDHRPHNFHVHDTQFRIAAIDGKPPPPELSGWKDTVYTAPGVPYTLIVRFADYADPTFPYMYHCHLLLHEDEGMMGQFMVLGPGQRPAPITMSDMPPG